MNTKQILMIVVVTFAFLGGVYLISSETRYISVSVPYQEPVYVTKTVEESVPYQEAVYKTVYSGNIGNYGLTGQTWTITNADSFTKDYTGEGFWGPEYQLKICWGTDCRYYYKIQFWDLQPGKVVTGYETKSRTEYKTVNEFARYDTKYRTENQYVTKTRLEWILG